MQHTLDGNTALIVVSGIGGVVAIPIAAMANRAHWSEGLKFTVAFGVSLLLGFLSAVLQGQTDPEHLLLAVGTTIVTAQSVYSSRFVKRLASKIELNVNGGTPEEGDDGGDEEKA